MGCWRMLAFLGVGDARMEGRAPGLVVLSVVSRAPWRWSAGDGWAAVIRRRSAAAIRRYLIIY